MSGNKEFQMANQELQLGERGDSSELQQATFELLEQLDELSHEQKEFLSNLSVQDQEILTALALEIAFTEEEGNGLKSGGALGTSQLELQDDPESQELLQKILLKASMEEGDANQDERQSSSTAMFMNALAQKVDLLANQNQQSPTQDQVFLAADNDIQQQASTLSDSTLHNNANLSASFVQNAAVTSLAPSGSSSSLSPTSDLTVDQILATADDIPVGSKEHALFALYVAHYQKEALKLTPAPNESDAKQDLTLNNSAIVVKAEQDQQQLQIAAEQYANSIPTSLTNNTDQMNAASNSMGIPTGAIIPESELEQLMLIQAAMASQQQQQTLPQMAPIDLNDIETMNAVMQEALQAAMMNQAAVNTMALNEALSAAASGTTEAHNSNPGGGGNAGNTFDLNGIDLTGVDLDNFDFSNIDLSNVDFSQMDFSGVDFSQIDMNQIGMCLNNGDGVTTFDLDAQSALAPGLNLNLSEAGAAADGENDAPAAAGKASKDKKEKKERKPAAPKEPKPPRVKAPQGPQICPTCHKTFKSRKTLTLHERSHAAVKPYPCLEPGCTSSFAQKSHLNAHKLTHSGERPYKCTLCDACYTTPSRRNEHMRSHTRETKYNCEECGMKFRNVTNYKNHMTTHLPKDQRPNKKWYCQQCDAVYAQRTSLIRHRNKMHPKSPEQIEQERLLKEQKRAEKLSKKNNSSKKIIITTPGTNIAIAANAAIAAIADQGITHPFTALAPAGVANSAFLASGDLAHAGSGASQGDESDMDQLDNEEADELMCEDEDDGMDMDEETVVVKTETEV